MDLRSEEGIAKFMSQDSPVFSSEVRHSPEQYTDIISRIRGNRPDLSEYQIGAEAGEINIESIGLKYGLSMYRHAYETSSPADEAFIFQEQAIFGVLDGLGADESAHEASRSLVEIIASQIKSSSVVEYSDEQLQHLMLESASIFARAYEDSSIATTSTVTSFSVSQENETCLTIANIGDSRAYLVRDGKCEQLTVDSFDSRTMIMDAAIMSDQLELIEKMEMINMSLQSGDRVILSSDGAHGKNWGVSEFISFGERALAGHELDAYELADFIAKTSVSNDDITVMVIDIDIDAK